MSRSGYTDDCENLQLWRGAVDSAIRGKRGQALLRDLRDAMDAMAVKVLIAGALQEDGDYCALGVVGAKRGIDMTKIDPEETMDVAAAFNIADALAKEVAYINDEEGAHYETPAERWTRVRKWVDKRIV